MIRKLVKANGLEFGFIPGRGKIDALFVVRRMQIDHRHEEKILYMCCVDIEMAFDIFPGKMLGRAMRKKGLPEVIVKWW